MIRTLLVLGFAVMTSVPPGEDDWKPLFNGRDLAGWETWLSKPHKSMTFEGLAKNEKGEYVEALGLNRDPHSNFSVVTQDGLPAIRVSGEVWGALTTKEEFENYHFRAEFKWGDLRWPPRQKTVRDNGLLRSRCRSRSTIAATSTASPACSSTSRPCRRSRRSPWAISSTARGRRR